MAHQEWTDLYRDQASGWGDKPDPTVFRDARMLQDLFTDIASGFHSDQWSASQCFSCREFSVWRGPRLIFPAVGPSTIPRAHAEMPPEVAALYNEAREVMPISRRAGAALARAALERLLRHLDPVEGRMDLAERIDRMLPKVSPDLGEALTIVRHAGNKSLHVEDAPDDLLVMVLDPDDEEIASILFDTVNDVVEERIARPARRRAAFEKVPERFRREIGKKTPQVPRECEIPLSDSEPCPRGHPRRARGNCWGTGPNM